jgi:excisionase family DNA binding protein
MVRYETYKEYAERTGISLSTVYRAARKGKLKTAIIKGVSHIIIEKEENPFFEDDKIDKPDNNKFDNNDKADKPYQEAEIIDTDRTMRYELEVFQSSIVTIEKMSDRIVNAKDELITNLHEIVDNQQKNIDNLNSIIKTISGDNQELRIQMGIRETELKICENEKDKLEKQLVEKDKIIDKLNNDISEYALKQRELEEQLLKMNEKINTLSNNKIKEEKNNFLHKFFKPKK